MAKKKSKNVTKARRERELHDGILRLIGQWAEETGWKVQRDPQTAATGDAAVRPDMSIETDNGRLILEAKSRGVGYDERVDLSAWPTLHRVKLIRRWDEWRVRTESGIDWPKPWNRQTFVELARLLAGAA